MIATLEGGGRAQRDCWRGQPCAACPRPEQKSKHLYKQGLKAIGPEVLPRVCWALGEDIPHLLTLQQSHRPPGTELWVRPRRRARSRSRKKRWRHGDKARTAKGVAVEPAHRGRNQPGSELAHWAIVGCAIQPNQAIWKRLGPAGRGVGTNESDPIRRHRHVGVWRAQAAR